MHQKLAEMKTKIHCTKKFYERVDFFFKRSIELTNL